MGQKTSTNIVSLTALVIFLLTLPLICGCDDIVEWLEPTPTEVPPTTPGNTDVQKATQPPDLMPTSKPTPTPKYTAAITFTPAPEILPETTPSMSTTAPSNVAVQPAPEATSVIEQQYEWEYEGSEWTWTSYIPQAGYDYYAELPRPPTDDYSVYVTHPLDDTYIDHLIESFEEAANEKGYDEFQIVNFIVNFVQSLPYTSDDVTKGYDEYPRYPIETLVDNGGDCEDTSILMAAILDQMGYGTILINPTNHLAVGVLGGENMYGAYWTLDERKYYYLETTGSGYEIGELPSEYQGISAKLYKLVPIPILTHEWNSLRTFYSFPRSYVELEIIVHNEGTADAKGTYVRAGFDAGNNMRWNIEESPASNLPAGYKRTLTMNLAIPQDKHTRIVVTVVQDGFVVSRSYSKWFDT
ncbi:MAG: hypothetical protein GY845_38315 [Planctomycetes bacterium]|nr:hypothetical protein [Planctomycetota bacterium]